ncbi:MAG: LytTR family transcriptional regulator [Lachnospiraceae bacterium]|nr:LytTR family transcriptional regulator [Lachnospiraceae bacterium]
MQELMISFVEGSTCLRADEIVYIESYRHRIIFHTEKKNYSIYKPLGEIEEMLAGMGFLRIHKSFIVNLEYVRSVKNYILTLYDGMNFIVPRGRYKEVKRGWTVYQPGALAVRGA